MSRYLIHHGSQPRDLQRGKSGGRGGVKQLHNLRSISTGAQQTCLGKSACRGRDVAVRAQISENGRRHNIGSIALYACRGTMCILTVTMELPCECTVPIYPLYRQTRTTLRDQSWGEACHQFPQSAMRPVRLSLFTPSIMRCTSLSFFGFRGLNALARLSYPQWSQKTASILRFATFGLKTVGLDQINLSSQTARERYSVPTTARVTYHAFYIACRDKAFGFNTQTCPLLNNTSFTFDDATVISTSSSSPSPPFTLLRLSCSHSSFAQ